MNASLSELSLSGTIGRHFENTAFADIASEAIAAAKLSLLDTLAVVWAALDAPGVPAVHRLATDHGGRPDARLWGTTVKLPAAEAAFANGVAAAALDFDALHLQGTVHADIVALPALLAVAERQHASGRELLTSYVLALDLIARLGLAAPGHSGWFYTSIHGIYGAAAGAARLLGLNAEGIRHALGLALPQAGGTQQPMVEKSQAKRLQSAFASRAGVFAAQLAAQGLTAPEQVFEGRFGAFALYEASDAGRITDQLGQRWENLGIGAKKYPNCGCAHAPLEAALQLIRAHGLGAGNVDAVRVVLTPYAHRLVGAPYAPHLQPEVSAQFSVQYALATALLHGGFGLDDITAERALAPETVALARRVQVEIDYTQSSRMGPATVEFAAGGRRYSATAQEDDVPGSAGNPLREADITEKALACFTRGPHVLQPHEAQRLVERIKTLEQLDDVCALWP